ncbi:MAG: hypothetical protein A2277_08775 [Desulfobacterales bacterium RIFOXYA12_FULL_46_15]|nr:MAG: hypothetical protein A2097_01130 [Desulfobacula sp. GWF2_41_7]OGR28414.1 MAG: hypothetical protein A2277_08775 [Desulfobacterales bacterium RIFOXYA12_FULL_46_15]
MKRFGSVNEKIREMNEDEIFLMYLHLLIVMIKASLKGYPTGEPRKTAALNTANTVHKLISNMDLSFLGLKTSSHLFRERVKLLSVMASAIISEDYPLGIHRREAVMDNIEIITEYAFPNKNLELFHEVLKVA